MKKRYVYALKDGAIGRKGGSKARNLRFLLRQGVPVPPGFVVSWGALEDHLREEPGVLPKLQEELAACLDGDKAYAVRSSAAVEDAGNHSCAGLFTSLLQVQGVEAVLQGVQTVWDSMAAEPFLAYVRTHGISVEPHGMGVILQEMVPAEASGVVFSRNPLTGLSETIIEVGPGNGEEQTKARKDPERWVMKWGNWLEKPAPSILPEAMAKALVRDTQRLSKRYGAPVDLEWAYDGTALQYLQIRPITRLDIPIYSNRITKEMLPGIIKPLVWSVNTRLINPLWTDILQRLSGDASITPDMLTGYHYSRAYFNMGLFGRVFEGMGMPYEALELLLGLEADGPEKPHMRPGLGFLRRVPQVTGFAWRFLSVEKELEAVLAAKEAAYGEVLSRMEESRTYGDWLARIEELFAITQEVAYLNIVVPMQMMMLHRLLAGRLKKEGIDIRTLRLEGVEEAKARYSPHAHLENLRRRYGLPEGTLEGAEAAALERDIAAFLTRFGHFSDSGNDCSAIPWRETPELILKMLHMPEHPGAKGTEEVAFRELSLSPGKRRMLARLHGRTSRFAIHREAVSSLYTYGYGQFRRGFLALGELLAQEAGLPHPEDVFYLSLEELKDRDALPKGAALAALLLERKAQLESDRRITPPETLYGADMPVLTPAPGKRLQGIPTSLGTYVGVARVLHGLSDFHRLGPGEVLVIPYSDVGWTPLFARAGAVVAEAGGMLSHSSIVAREYRIPAVVSVRGALTIPDGSRVRVNGHTGEVHLEEALLAQGADFKRRNEP